MSKKTIRDCKLIRSLLSLDNNRQKSQAMKLWKAETEDAAKAAAAAALSRSDDEEDDTDSARPRGAKTPAKTPTVRQKETATAQFRQYQENLGEVSVDCGS